MYKLVFFVPETHKEHVKQAVFEAGAGEFDGYDCCSWEAPGQGQFRPLAGSQPFIGEKNKIEQVSEFRVELICRDENIQEVLEALLQAHPYETPAYECWQVKMLKDFTRL